jgi:hypothetical protein
MQQDCPQKDVQARLTHLQVPNLQWEAEWGDCLVSLTLNVQVQGENAETVCK